MVAKSLLAQPESKSGTWPERAGHLTFEERFEEICFWVDKRRRGIDLIKLEWADVRSLLITRVWRQYGSYDPAKGPFKNWLNRVLSNERNNIWRDHVGGMARPCVTGKGGGCVENMGSGLCRKTPSGLQCSECPAFRDWEKRKGAQYAIEHTVPLDIPVDGEESTITRREAVNTQADYVDYAVKGALLHKAMRKRLTRVEYKAYRLLIIKGMADEEVAKEMGFKAKRGKKSKMYAGYASILAWRHLFVKVAREVIEENDLA